MNGLNIGLRYFTVRRFNLFLLDLSEALLEVGEIAGRRQEHQQVFKDIFEASVDISCELPDELSSHIVFHSKKG
jgi:hypothetical protein